MTILEGNKLIVGFMKVPEKEIENAFDEHGHPTPLKGWLFTDDDFYVKETTYTEVGFQHEQVKSVRIATAYGLNYNLSWDWLMPVVDKIETLGNDFHGNFGVHITGNSCTIQGSKLDTRRRHFHPAYLSDTNAIFPTKIESTWYNVVAFIQWYDTQSK